MPCMHAYAIHAPLEQVYNACSTCSSSDITHVPALGRALAARPSIGLELMYVDTFDVCKALACNACVVNFRAPDLQ
jgi:hypothetical protein